MYNSFVPMSVDTLASVPRTIMVDENRTLDLPSTLVTSNTPGTPATPLMVVDENVNHRTLDSYDFLEKKGSGAQGTVWKARVKDTGKIIALKVLDIKNSQVLEQTRIEINNLIKISNPYCHSYLACYYDSHYDSNTRQMLIEMEYVDGVDLNTWANNLRNRDNFNYYLMAVMIYLCKAINYINSLNIIHRDIKPGNILIDKNDYPKLVDFGLACQSKICPTVIPDLAYTCCYGKVGTPAYMAPETVTVGEAFFSSDIWSLGATIFNSATGKYHYPFENVNDKKPVLETIAYTQPFLLDTNNVKLNTAVNSCLNKDPLTRITVSDLLSFLEGRN